MKHSKNNSVYNFLTILLELSVISNTLVYSQNEPKLSQSSKFIYLISPHGTETFYYGENIDIVWNSSYESKINLQYLNEENKWIDIIYNINSKVNFYKWNISENIPSKIKIRIIDSEDSKFSDVTQFFIRILNRPKNKINYKSSQTDNLSTTSVKKIMLLGDSITEGYLPDPDSIIYNGYRKKLKKMLTDNGLEFDFVGSLVDGTFIDNQHEGHGGYSAKHWANASNYDLYSHLTAFLTNSPSDIILFHIGTNDINDFKWSNDLNVANTTVSDVSGDLDLIYNFNPNIKVILAKIINRTDDLSTLALNESNATTQFNLALSTMATARSEYGTHLFLVEMESALAYPTDLSDGIHPNFIGYNKMSPVWFTAIINILPKLNLKVFLEGAYTGTSNMLTTLNSAGKIPQNQPFNQSPWSFSGTEYVSIIPSGVVDWVLVSLRTGTSASTTVAQRAGFVKSDGTIVDLDGTSPLAFVVDSGYYYVVVEHRNHLPIMSSIKINITP
jgi:hypothetical protein